MTTRTRTTSRMLTAALVALFVLGAHAADDTATYKSRYAVCIGVNHNTDYPKLNYAENDATDMATMLERYGFDGVTLLTGDNASHSAILDAIAQIKTRLTADDLVVVYFAGHGWTVRDAESNLNGYLVTADTRRGQESTTGISMRSLHEMANSLPNRHTLFLTDACYSGYGLTGKALASKTKIKTIATDGRHVEILAAGGQFDRAFEADGHGLFTRHILDHLENTISAARKTVSGSDLAAYVQKKVADYTGGWQTPQYGRFGSGTIVLTATPVAGTDLAMVTP